MKLVWLAFALFFLSGVAFAFGETCPANAPDCFMCGAGPTGVPCNRNCTAHSVPGLGYVSCEVPDTGPRCYCPYGTTFEEIAANSPDCRASSFPDCNGCGYLESYSGAVLVKSAYAGTSSDWCVVKGRLRLPQGTQVWTTAGSAVRITYPRVTMDVGPSSELTIARASLGPHTIFSIDAVRAMYRIAFKELSEDEWFDLQVDQAFSGCVGTEFLVQADPSTVTIKVLDGTVWMKGANAAKNVTLNPGQYATAPRTGGAPSDPASFNPDAEDKWWSGLESSGGGCCGSAFIFLFAPLLLAFIMRR